MTTLFRFRLFHVNHVNQNLIPIHVHLTWSWTPPPPIDFGKCSAKKVFGSPNKMQKRSKFFLIKKQYSVNQIKDSSSIWMVHFSLIVEWCVKRMVPWLPVCNQTAVCLMNCLPGSCLLLKNPLAEWFCLPNVYYLDPNSKFTRTL